MVVAPPLVTAVSTAAPALQLDLQMMITWTETGGRPEVGQPVIRHEYFMPPARRHSSPPTRTAAEHRRAGGSAPRCLGTVPARVAARVPPRSFAVLPTRDAVPPLAWAGIRDTLGRRSYLRLEHF